MLGMQVSGRGDDKPMERAAAAGEVERGHSRRYDDLDLVASVVFTAALKLRRSYKVTRLYRNYTQVQLSR